MATFNDLNPAVPGDNDTADTGDNEIRALKQTLQDVFRNNPAPLTFLDDDLTLDPVRRIRGNKQVSIAGGTIDGTSPPSILGNSYGIQTVQRTGNGTYEIQLIESAWGARGIDDLQVAWSVDYLIFGPGLLVLRAPVVNSITNGWCQVITAPATDPDGPIDSLFKVTFFDSGRL